jgi:hypothetical protein
MLFSGGETLKSEVIRNENRLTLEHTVKFNRQNL